MNLQNMMCDVINVTVVHTIWVYYWTVIFVYYNNVYIYI